MSNAPLDENGREAIICVSSTDGSTIVPIKGNPTNHTLDILDDTTGSDNGNGNAELDENGRSAWIALSSAGNGKIIEVYADASTGKLLTNSN